MILTPNIRGANRVEWMGPHHYNFFTWRHIILKVLIFVDDLFVLCRPHQSEVVQELDKIRAVLQRSLTPETNVINMGDIFENVPKPQLMINMGDKFQNLSNPLWKEVDRRYYRVLPGCQPPG